MNFTTLTPVSHIKRVLIANRGEIAVRIIKTCKKLGITSIAIYTQEDTSFQHVKAADIKVLLPESEGSPYMNIDAILHICSEQSVDAVIPGYGFLSETADFAQRVALQGMVFVGPSPNAIKSMGLKHLARALAVEASVPVVPGSGLLSSADAALQAADELGYPIMLKASGGGGGMGLQVCHSGSEVKSAFETVQSRGLSLFKEAGVFLEKYYPESHHIEVQIFGNGSSAVHFGERECSIQRRHQKVIEECPSPFVTSRPGLREKLTSCAVALASSIGYSSAGTVEFLVDDHSGDFFFLEMNTRLQVEHGITEMCYDVDLVSLMLLQADYQLAKMQGIPFEDLMMLQKSEPNGCAIEARLYAENPANGFSPSVGLLQAVEWPAGEGIRIDTFVETGNRISPSYDPMIAKVMTHASDRASSTSRMVEVLGSSKIGGLVTNLHLLRQIVASKAFSSGRTLTSFLSTQYKYQPSGILVNSPGASTTIQDLPGRVNKGYGIPRSGPMDDFSPRVANMLVGNDPNLEVLEITMIGPELTFNTSATIAVCGAEFPVILDGQSKKMWSRLRINAGQRLSIGALVGKGCRCYLAVKGGFPSIPQWLGSKSTTPSLGLGGLQGRQLLPGDYIELADPGIPIADYCLPVACIPSFDINELYVLRGPHDSPDLIVPESIESLYNSSFTVDLNSSRTGVRLVGPSPSWARKDGGEGGTHPSNLVDYPYPSPGGVNWTGDSACIFPVDGPDLGGFLCSSTVISADLWRLGQVGPGSSIKLRPTNYHSAVRLQADVATYFTDLEDQIKYERKDNIKFPALDTIKPQEISEPILKVLESDQAPKFTLRQGGDNFVLVEIGQQRPSCGTAAIARLFSRLLQSHSLGRFFVQMSISSISVSYSTNSISQDDLVQLITSLHSNFSSSSPTVPCRELRLPIAFDHPRLQAAVQRYTDLQRSKAAYLPDNVGFLQRNNGLAKRSDIFDAITNTKFLVVAVGFLTGLPFLFPLNPLSILKSPKYNPSRIYTPRGTVGMAGSTFAIYPADQPGGYMLLGMTLPPWDTFGTKPSFSPARPWLCEPFDIISFERVDLEKFAELEEQFDSGSYAFNVQDTAFSLEEHEKMLQQAIASDAVQDFRTAQAKAIAEMAEVEEQIYAQWLAEQKTTTGRAVVLDAAVNVAEENKVQATIGAKVWKVLVEEGVTVSVGQPLFVLEAMKMEITIVAEGKHDGAVVEKILVEPGVPVSPGALLAVLKRT